MQALSSPLPPPFWASFIKSPSSCRDQDWVCVRIFQDSSEKQPKQREVLRHQLGLCVLWEACRGLCRAAGPLLKPGTGYQGISQSCLAAWEVPTLTPTPTMLLKELLLSAGTHSIFSFPAILLKTVEKVLSKTGAAGLLQIDKPCKRRQYISQKIYF